MYTLSINSMRGLILLFGILLTSVFAKSETFTVSPFQYTVISSEESTVKIAAIENLLSSFVDLIVPSEVVYNDNTYTVTQIDSYGFADSKNLKTVSLPETITTIGFYSFGSCGQLSKINLPNSLTSIGGLALGYCYNLTEIYIPAYVSEIANGSFMGCTGLKKFVVDENNPTFKADGAMLLSKDGTTLVSYPSASGDCILPEGIITIGDISFGATSITSLLVPSTVRRIGNMVVEECPKMMNWYLKPTLPPTLGFDNFPTAPDLAFTKIRIYVPEDAMEIYKLSPYWSIYGHILVPWNPNNGDSHVMMNPADLINTDFRVYSLEGKLLLECNDKESLRKLPNGLYIINGKKVLLNN